MQPLKPIVMRHFSFLTDEYGYTVERTFDDQHGVGVWWRKGATTVVISYARYSAEFHIVLAIGSDRSERKLDLYEILAKSGVKLPVHRPREMDKIDADMAEHAALFREHALPVLNGGPNSFEC
ncbi:MAG TPA: hypothetical protein VJP85_06620 [Candidatus Baltobacteraceae bacterium]|nr:hypothetical protein [Candidatus Baltobacteraceae bacterium]